MKEPIMKKTGLFDGGGSEDNGKDEEQASGCDNAFLRLPYGLAKEKGLSTEGMRPREVWELLKGYGVDKDIEDKKT